MGFYSSFIVSDLVEVISKQEGQPAHKWSSDGTGTFEISEVPDETLVRGTRVIMHIKDANKKFLEKT